MQKKEEKTGVFDFLKSAGIGVATAIIATLLLSVLWASLTVSETLDWSDAGTLTMVTAMIACIAGGLVAGKIYKSRVLAVGGAVGAIFVLLMLASTAAFAPTGKGSTLLLWKVICAIFGGLTGGILSVIKIKKRRS